MKARSLGTTILVPILFAGVALTVATVLVLTSLKKRSIESAGFAAAAAVGDQVKTLRGFYTKEVVSRAKKGGLGINYDWDKREGTLPLPATLEKGVLTQAGYDVATALDGEEALTTLAAGGIELVITDYEMPRVDGLELLRRMRADPRFASVPAIMVTSRADVHATALEAGARACVIKRAFDQEQLVDTVARLLDEPR